MGVRRWLIPVLLLVTPWLSACLVRGGGPNEEQWVEVFEFEVQPPDLDDGQAADLVADMFDGDVISAEHVGWVESPGGRVDFVNHTQVDPSLGPLPVFCQSIIADLSASTGCGGDDAQGDPPLMPIEMRGGGSTELWVEAEFVVSDEVAQVVGVAAGGAAYTITPRDGFGYVKWPSRRGALDLIAYDANGNELGRERTFAP